MKTLRQPIQPNLYLLWKMSTESHEMIETFLAVYELQVVQKKKLEAEDSRK